MNQVANIFLISTFLLVGGFFIDEEPVKFITRGNYKFAQKLYNELSNQQGNVFFSPLSLQTILSLLHQGSAGESEKALRESLGLPAKSKSADGYSTLITDLNNEEHVQLEVANKVYISNGFNLLPSFKDVAVNSFCSEAENIDFTKSNDAAATINKWVQQKTKDNIKDLIDPKSLHGATRMVLVNAIYFKGEWDHKFNKENTKREPFYTSDSRSVDCDMMHLTQNIHYKEDPDLDAQILQLDYANKNIHMLIVLPKQRNGIKDLEEKMKGYDMSELTEGLYKPKITLSLPKFTIEAKMQLNTPLENIGLRNIFSSSANFTDLIDSDEALMVDQVVQKAFIVVNEEGAEAAAATGLQIIPISLPMPDLMITFKADHPFIFHILTSNNLVLFSGRLESL